MCYLQNCFVLFVLYYRFLYYIIGMEQDSCHNEGSRESGQTNIAVKPTSFDGIVPVVMNPISPDTLLIQV